MVWKLVVLLLLLLLFLLLGILHFAANGGVELPRWFNCRRERLETKKNLK